MMILKRKAFAIIMSLVLTLAMLSCGTPSDDNEEIYDPSTRTAMNEKEVSYEFMNAQTYRNPISTFGAGDPYVFRWNGKYYLFPSADRIGGIRAYVSDDMVNWTAHPELVVDFNTDPTPSQNYYAPEIIYYNGAFYLCTSPNGGGHYFYKSTTDSPLGPYTCISGNLRRGIDGAFYLRDDGKLFLLHTNVDPAGLRMSEILDFEAERDEDKLGKQVLIEGANLNHWIEGPGVIRRGDVSYLTYTGNHVVSIGYRIAYSYFKTDNIKTEDIITPDSFIQPENNVTFISTIDDFSGLGHSSNAYGPDLDSIYTAYHNRNNGRFYNLDRYLTNGVRLTSNGNTHIEADAPLRPSYEAIDNSELVNSSGFMLSNVSNNDYYTAEFNYVPDSGSIILNYIDNQNYSKIEVSANDSSIKLLSIVDGISSTIESKPIKGKNNFSKLGTVRVEKTLKNIIIFFNGMKVIAVDYVGKGGRIGYTDGTNCSYTAFTNDVFGTSDFEATKNIPSKIPAHSYLKGENRGFYFQNGVFNDSPRMDEKNTIVQECDQYSVVLDAREDYVKYPIRAQSPSIYSLVLEIAKDSMGSIIEVIVGEEEIYKFQIPTNLEFGDDLYIPYALGNIELAGKTTIKIRLWKGTLKFRQLEFYEDGELEELQLFDGQSIIDSFSSKASAHYTISEDNSIQSNQSGRNMLLGGNSGAANFVYEVDVAVDNLSSGGEGGIVFRAKNYSYHADQAAQSFQGYYLQIRDRIATLFKYDYGAKTLHVMSLRNEDNQPIFSSGAYARVRIKCLNNRIVIWVRDKKVCDIYDNYAFMDGQIGFYSVSASFAYKNLLYAAIQEI